MNTPTNGAAPQVTTTAQQRFDELYITSAEIARTLEVSRPTIQQARQRGLLPDPVNVGDGTIYIWERVVIRPYLAAWAHSLACRRGTLNKVAIA